eukprot:CAMPEP_0194394378 /NCGR_PEP_ID=MMETSP0174-20130528/123822_1 /TAXON_ID=216777 /ORGANISM="Proboscia alata, Strain PI-D3" /LENGTH=621 /DNA_ID=CAMNT_0039190171 /DNA_START=620 /DNA_END=2482 /DNA_ORIENTATION=-
MSYTENSSWDAFEAADIVSAGGSHLSYSAGITNYDFSLRFGCQTSISGMFIGQLADGIMGVSRSSHGTFWSQMYEAGKIDKKQFSLCFGHQNTANRNGTLAGVMTMGGYDERLHFSPMVFTSDIGSKYFTVDLEAIHLRLDGLKNVSSDLFQIKTEVKLAISPTRLNIGSAIVDSGTTHTSFSNKIASSFKKAWIRLTGNEWQTDPFELSEEDFMEMPTIVLHLRSFHNSEHDNVLVSFPASKYLTRSIKSGFFQPSLRFEGRGSILGANIMQGHDIFFDIENKRIGWAESSCQFLDIADDPTSNKFYIESNKGTENKKTDNNMKESNKKKQVAAQDVDTGGSHDYVPTEIDRTKKKTDVQGSKSDETTDDTNFLINQTKPMTDVQDVSTGKSNGTTGDAHTRINQTKPMTDVQDVSTGKSNGTTGDAHTGINQTKPMTDVQDVYTGKSNGTTGDVHTKINQKKSTTGVKDVNTGKSNGNTGDSHSINSQTKQIIDVKDVYSDKSSKTADDNHTITNQTKQMIDVDDFYTGISYGTTGDDHIALDQRKPNADVQDVYIGKTFGTTGDDHIVINQTKQMADVQDMYADKSSTSGGESMIFPLPIESLIIILFFFTFVLIITF